MNTLLVPCQEGTRVVLFFETQKVPASIYIYICYRNIPLVVNPPPLCSTNTASSYRKIQIPSRLAKEALFYSFRYQNMWNRTSTHVSTEIEIRRATRQHVQRIVTPSPFFCFQVWVLQPRFCFHWRCSDKGLRIPSARTPIARP